MSNKVSVRCPSCETTFAVPSSLLEGRSSERFHCSRCDSVFSQDFSASADELSSPEKAPSGVHPSAAGPQLANDIEGLIAALPQEEDSDLTESPAAAGVFANEGDSALDLDGTEVDATPGSFKAAADKVSPQKAAREDSEAEEIFRTESSRPGADLDLFTSKTDGADFPTTDTPTSINVKLASSGEDLTSVPAGVSGVLAEGPPPVQTGLGLDEPSIASPVIEDALAELTSAKTTEIPADTAQKIRSGSESGKGSKKKKYIPTNVELGPAPVQEELPGTRDKELSAAATAELYENFSPGAHLKDIEPRLISGMKSIVYISAPILCFLAVLGGVSFYLRTDSTLSEKFAQVFSSQPQVAPAGVLVENTAFEPVVLPTGEKVYLISGRITNRTSDTVKNVVVEGVAFDDTGKPVSSVRTAATSTIEKSELSLMSIDNIKKLQQVRGKASIEIPAGSEKEFSLAIVNDRGEEPEFYTARIFSVSL